VALPSERANKYTSLHACAPTLDVYIGSNLNFERLRACDVITLSLSLFVNLISFCLERARLIWANILIARGGVVVAKPPLDLLFGRIPTSQSVPLCVCVCVAANKIYCQRRRVAARTHGDNPPPSVIPLPMPARPALFAIWPV
jgi:hypothetical protein